MTSAATSVSILGFSENFAVLNGHQRCDAVDPLPHQGCRLTHDLGALERCDRSPDLKSLVGSGERLVEVGTVGMSDRSDLLFGSGVENGDSLAGGAGAPPPVDQQRCVLIAQGDLLRLS